MSEGIPPPPPPPALPGFVVPPSPPGPPSPPDSSLGYPPEGSLNDSMRGSHRGSEDSLPQSTSSRNPILPVSSSVARLGVMGGNTSPSLARYDDEQNPTEFINYSPAEVDSGSGLNGGVSREEETGFSDNRQPYIQPQHVVESKAGPDPHPQPQPEPEPYREPDSNPDPEPQPELDPDTGMVMDNMDSTAVIMEGGGEYTQRLDQKETMFFTQTDEKKRIDYVLVYKSSENEEKAPEKEEKPQRKVEKRRTFQANLEAEGLELEIEDKSMSVDKETYYVKIHAPWEVLLRGCELLGMRKRIKMPKNLEEKLKGSSCCRPFEAGTDIIPEEDDYFTMPFNRNRMELFYIENRSTFFTNTERTLIVKEILDRTSYTSRQDGDAVRFDAGAPDNDHKEDIQNGQDLHFGIRGLLNNNTYTAAFPLHEGPFKLESEGVDRHTLFQGPDKDRAKLYDAWARPGRFLCYQPLDLIRTYFGEKVAIYFAWLGFYTQMLIPASIIGLAVFAYGIVTLLLGKDIPSNDICDELGVGNYTMCPLCDIRCSYWKLHESCLYSKLTYLFDNYATAAFAAFMAIWATLFLEFWKRKQTELEYDWDVANFELEEKMRPEFEFKVTKKKENPITRLQEPYLSFFSRGIRTCTSCTVIAFMIALVLAAIFAVVLYRIIVVSLFYIVSLHVVSDYAKLWTSFSAAAINVVAILILNIMYRVVAVKLTDMECHRTDTEYEDSFTFKMFLFQFINFYGSIFYIAFFKGKFVSSPGTTDNYVFGRWKQDECDPAGCLIELCIQLAMVMILKQALNNGKELLLPVFKRWFLTRKAKKQEEGMQEEGNVFMRWEQDNRLSPVTNLGLFDEYLEMVIQFGFVTIFVAAFPLAPFFALLNNIIEIRLDAYKFVTAYQRPFAARAQDIGAWYGILQGLSFIAVLSNSFIIGYTAEFVPRMVYLFAYSNDTTLNGFTANGLSLFDVKDFTNTTRPDNLNEDEFGKVAMCRYKGYLYPPTHENAYQYTTEYWVVTAARLGFVIVFEHFCFLFTWIITVIIPDVPGNVKRLMLYEKQLTKKITFDATFAETQEENKRKSGIRHRNGNAGYDYDNPSYHVGEGDTLPRENAYVY